MECTEILSALQSMASEKYKANVVRMGIPESHSIGVSTVEIRKMAKGIEKSNDLAYELWKSGYHEARLLAVLLFEKKKLPLPDAERLMDDVVSWDLCDHLCKNLIIKLNGYETLIDQWCDSNKTYYKRGAFVLIAADVIHNKSISVETLDRYLSLIENHSVDDRDHVKKAVSCALREIGKKDFTYQEKAILLAHELKETGSKARLWIAKDALKELEKLVRTEGRSRLISSDSAMGKVTIEIE